MTKYLLMLVLIMPCISFAETKCKVIDFPDHNEVDCNGDEAATKSAVQKTLPVQPMQTQIPSDINPQDTGDLAPLESPIKSPQQETTVSSPSAPQATPYQPTNSNRHSRQQYQQSLEDARSARRQFILDKQQPTAPISVPSVQ